MAYQRIHKVSAWPSPDQRKPHAFAPRPFAQRKASAVAPAPQETVVQRVIVKGEEKGDYFDDGTNEKFAFAAQSRTEFLYAKRADLKKLRDLILKEDGTDPENEYAVSLAMRSWRKSYEEGSASTATADAFKAIGLMLVTESEEVEAPEQRSALLNVIAGVLNGNEETWGKLQAKKAGFGERAPKGKGTVYVNRDNAVSLASVADFLGVDKNKDFKEEAKFADVKFVELAGFAYQAKLLLEPSAESIPQERNNFFYVSTATREARTTSGIQGNYVLNGSKETEFDDIPSDDVRLNDSYDKLVTDRSVKEWAKVDRVGIRAGTQDQCMDNWNALGMAAYAKKVLNRNSLNLAQDYEWLHIRGVQNGGRNEIGNLGTGTWIANSAMIPYENKIRAWADKKPGSIEARYETTTNPVDSPVLDKITIKVAATATHEIGPIDRADPLEVEFDAQSGSVTDSFANKVKLKHFGLSQEERRKSAKYRRGVAAAQANQPAGLDLTAAEGRKDYLDGVAAAKAGNPANPLKPGQGVGHADYASGVAAARLGQNAGNKGHAEGHADYLAGVADARAGNLAGTGGHAQGHADYVAGVNAAAAGGFAFGWAAQSGFNDYQTGETAADTNQLPANWGEIQGYTARRKTRKDALSRKRDPLDQGESRKKEFL